MNRHQQEVIAFLQEENRVLLEQLGGKPRHFTDAQRVWLARKAKPVGRPCLGQINTLFIPDTLLRWFRAPVAKKWTFARTNPVGRPPVDPELEKLVIKLITENLTCGSNSIVGALDNLGFKALPTYMVCTGECPSRSDFHGLTAAPLVPPTCRRLAPDILLFPSAIGLSDT
jgi:hypothetical protein